jgi:hypothetical protein
LESRVAQLKRGHFYWVLVRSSTEDPEWQPARFAGAVGHSAGGTWHLIGFNSDVGHHFAEVVEIGPELTEGPEIKPAPAAPPMDF